MKLRVPRPMWIATPTAVLVIGAVLLHLAWPLYQQFAAIRLIESLGGIVESNPRGPTWLRNLIGDERMEPFDDVVSVGLGQTAATDADLARICVLTSLEDVAIADIRITDAGLEHLGRLRRLRSLILLGTPITDAGLVHLRVLNKLEYLDLGSTRITDAGLQHLQGLTRLANLDVRNTAVTDAGVVELQRALPDLTIER